MMMEELVLLAWTLQISHYCTVCGLLYEVTNMIAFSPIYRKYLASFNR
jgi:hypothetical protein